MAVLCTCCYTLIVALDGQVDVPYCLATAPSSNPPRQPRQPPAINTSLSCAADHPTLLVFAGKVRWACALESAQTAMHASSTD